MSTTTGPTYTALRAYHHTVNGMLEDPDVTGDLLLIGLWMARAYHLRTPPPGEGRWGFKAIARDLYGRGHAYTMTGFGTTTHVASHHIARVKSVLTDDIPRYDPLKDNERLWHPFGGYECAASMIRRDGTCGKHATRNHHLTDVTTGRVHVLAACHRHHGWLDEQMLRNREQVAALGEHLPKPAMNAGGTLARHLPNLTWHKVWAALRPTWTPPAEGAPTGKPRLEVLTFEPCDEDPDSAVTERPTFGVIKGGWR